MPRPIFEIITEIHDWQYQVVKDRIACLSCSDRLALAEFSRTNSRELGDTVLVVCSELFR